MPDPNPLLPAGAVATLDRLLDRLRADVCVIKRPPAGLDAAGAPASGSYTTVVTTDCRVDAGGTRPLERVAGPRYGSEADYTVSFFRTGIDVHEDDRIEVNGTTLEVINVPDAASFGLQLVVPCRFIA